MTGRLPIAESVPGTNAVQGSTDEEIPVVLGAWVCRSIRVVVWSVDVEEIPEPQVSTSRNVQQLSQVASRAGDWLQAATLAVESTAETHCHYWPKSEIRLLIASQAASLGALPWQARARLSGQ